MCRNAGIRENVTLRCIYYTHGENWQNRCFVVWTGKFSFCMNAALSIKTSTVLPFRLQWIWCIRNNDGEVVGWNVYFSFHPNPFIAIHRHVWNFMFVPLNWLSIDEIVYEFVWYRLPIKAQTLFVLPIYSSAMDVRLNIDILYGGDSR